ncbi:MAG: hypothetical protein ACXVGT_18145 [Oryzihumus sp.]
MSTARGSSRPRIGRVLLLAAAVVVAVAAVGAVRMYRIHEAGWEWRLTPSAAPPKVHFAGRDYERGSEFARVPSTWTRQGTTPGGGTVYAPAGGSGEVPVVVYVRDGRETVGYGLMGGP